MILSILGFVFGVVFKLFSFTGSLILSISRSFLEIFSLVSSSVFQILGVLFDLLGVKSQDSDCQDEE